MNKLIKTLIDRQVSNTSKYQLKTTIYVIRKLNNIYTLILINSISKIQIILHNSYNNVNFNILTTNTTIQRITIKELILFTLNLKQIIDYNYININELLNLLEV